MGATILGLSAFYHDSAACLVSDGRIVAAAQEERFTRKRHDAGFPARAAAYCLAEAGLGSASELDHVVFYDKPIVKFERLLQSYLHEAPHGLRSFLMAMPLWLKQKLWMSETIGDALEYDGPVLYTEHHESHAASAFFPSPYRKAAILTIDGVGEWATASLGVGEGNRVRLLKELRFPHSLGLLYSAFTYFTGFTVNSGEYKLMGLVPYGSPIYVDRILDEIVEIKDDGSLHLNMRYFDYVGGLRMTSPAFDELFGGLRRAPESPLTQREMDLAASIQVVTEMATLAMARFAHRETGLPSLCIAGGVALNCVANGRILREGPFASIWIQPAAGDAGGALGAALLVHHQILGAPREPSGIADTQSASLLGPSFADDEIAAFLEAEGIPSERYADEESLVRRVADALANEAVVGWFQGRMEFGPRALGSRSILGDPRSPSMQTTMNLKVKFRESFRPFAPSVLREHASEWFDLDVDSPYMLLVAPVAARRRLPVGETGVTGLARLAQLRSTIPAVTHVDGSARVQTVRPEENPRYHRLITAFHERTGCPVVVNTSFNVRGEPIVCTPADAYRCFCRTNIDLLVLGSFVIDRKRVGLAPASPPDPSERGRD